MKSEILGLELRSRDRLSVNKRKALVARALRAQVLDLEILRARNVDAGCNLGKFRTISGLRRLLMPA